MTHLPATNPGTDERWRSPDADWTDRERALLDAWDAEHAPPPPDHDEAFEQRVLAACLALDQIGIDDLGDDEDVTMAAIRHEAVDEHASAERESAQRKAEAFRKLAERHHDVLRKFALRLSGRRDLADDLVQETMHRALVHFDRFVPGSNALAWMTTILTNVHIDQLRGASRRAARAWSLEEVPAVERDPDRGFLALPDDTLWRAVETLDADLRQVVELHYRTELTYKEIARKLGLPISTVGTRLLRARHLLSQRLRPHVR